MLSLKVIAPFVAFFLAMVAMAVDPHASAVPLSSPVPTHLTKQLSMFSSVATIKGQEPSTSVVVGLSPPSSRSQRSASGTSSFTKTSKQKHLRQLIKSTPSPTKAAKQSAPKKPPTSAPVRVASIGNTPGPTRAVSRQVTRNPTTAAPRPVTPKPTKGVTRNPTSALTLTAKPYFTVGAYYYPWHGQDFHKGAPYLRDQLSPKQRPALGRYDDTDPAVIAQHLKWSRQANIQLWVTSWWGPGSREDVTTLGLILPHIDMGTHKIALFYETTGRIREKNKYAIDAVIPDVVYMCKNYFSHPNYYKINGRPVLFMYITRKYSQLGFLEGILLLMRNTAADYGFNPYIIGDQVFRAAPTGDYAPFSQLDAVTNYDVRGGMIVPVGTNYITQSGVDDYYAEQAKWKAAANKKGCAFVPTAVPGYNDRAIRLGVGNAAVSRRLTPQDVEGSLFRASLKAACKLAGNRTNRLMMINSFNEWHEDSQIEPTVGGNKTVTPLNLTQGVAYQAYGELFLNILGQETY
jgi:glycoprotein endo-alpha-1,2-mannosidase